MQAMNEHMGARHGYIETVKKVYKQEGPIGFYRGFFPPFFGSVIFRSVQFSIFEACYTKWASNQTLCTEIPFTGGLEPRTVLAGAVGGAIRSFIECPFEYVKVRRQTGQQWHFNQIYLGMRVQMPRATLMISSFFS